MFVRVSATFDLDIPEFLFGVSASCLEPGYAVYSVDSQSEAVYLVLDRQLKRGIYVASLLITAHVHVLVIIPVVAEPMDQPGITVEIEDDRLIHGEQAVEFALARAVGMLTGRLQPVQVDHVHEAHFEIRQTLAQDCRGGERLLSSDVAAGGHHHVRFLVLVVARPCPDADAFRAMHDGLVYCGELQMLLLVGNDDVDAVS